jgi:tRNA/rRNA methyltransferase
MIEIIVIELRKQENLGAIARAMKNFEFTNLILIDPKCSIGATAEKVSKHGIMVLKKTKIKGFDYLKKHDYLVGTTAKLGTDYNLPRSPITAGQLARKVSHIDHGKLKIGIVIGRESIGLKNDEINLCDILVTIPASRKYPTINISHAVSIILYELFKESSADKSNSHINFATAKEKSIIMKYMDKVFYMVDFSTKDKKETQKKVWKRIFGKAFLTKREAFTVMGFLRKLTK